MADTSFAYEPGTPVPQGFIPLCVPQMTGREWDYVKDCLDTSWVSSAGSYVDRFESGIAGYVGARYGVAMTSGTAALHIALLVAGVRPDDEVLVSTLTFIAPANAIRYLGAWPVFIDADPVYGQMDPERIFEFLNERCTGGSEGTIDSATGRRVSAIVPVHILGHPVDLTPIVDAAHAHGLAVVEDATESLGATLRGQSVGRIGDVGCFSFNGNKLLTTGGGGMLVTDREDWARQARYLSTQAKDDPIEYIHGDVGYNYRLTNVQAAMGCAQLEAIDSFLASKRRIYARYVEGLAAVPGISVLPEAPWARSACWLSTVRVNEEKFGIGSRALLRQLESSDIQTRPLWQPLHRSLPHQGSPTCGGSVAERFADECLNLPSSVGLAPEIQERVIAAVVDAGGR